MFGITNFLPPEEDGVPFGGNTYLSGYGFLEQNSRLPRHFKRTVSVIATAVIGVLTLPTLLFVPVRVFVRLLASATGKATSHMALVNGVMAELQEIFLYLFSILLPLYFLHLCFKKVDGKAFCKAPDQRIWRYALPLALTVMVLAGKGGQFLNELFFHLHIVPLTPNNMLPANNWLVLFYLIRVMFLPAVLEEYLFRGIVLHALRPYGDTFAVVLSSICYGMVQHTITGNLGGFVFGLLLGYFVLRTGSFVTAAGCRLCVGAVGSVMVLVQRFFPSYYNMGEMLLFAILLFLGVVSFIFLCAEENHSFVTSGANNFTSISHRLKLCLSSGAVIAALIVWGWQMYHSVQFMGF